MADKPFDRVVFNPREKPLAGDVNLAQAQGDQTFRAFCEKFYAVRATAEQDAAFTPRSGFVADSFRVAPTDPASLSVVVRAGIGYHYANITNVDVVSSISGIAGLNDRQGYKPLVLTGSEVIPLTPVPVAGTERVDIIEVRYERALEDTSTRLTFSPFVGDFTAGNVKKTLSFALDNKSDKVFAPAASTAPISRKIGVPAVIGAAAVPATTPGYVKIAEILVPGAAASVDDLQIVDTRPLLFPHNTAHVHMRVAVRTILGAPLTPVLLSLNAPPGIRVCYSQTTSIAAQGVLSIMAGQQMHDVSYSVRPWQLTFNPGTFPVALNQGVAVGTALAFHQALFNSAQTTPVTKIGVGQPFAVCAFSFTQDTGTPLGLDDPLFFEVDARLAF